MPPIRFLIIRLRRKESRVSKLFLNQRVFTRSCVNLAAATSSLRVDNSRREAMELSRGSHKASFACKIKPAAVAQLVGKEKLSMALPEAFLPAFSAAEYLAIERASEIRHEFLDGLVYAMAGESPPSLDCTLGCRAIRA